MISPSTVDDASGNPREVIAAIRRFVLSRPDLIGLLGQQSRLLPSRVFPDVDKSGEQLLDIYLEEHLSFFEFVRPHLRPRCRVLDVGGGCGFFHVLAQRVGADILSVEPAESGFSLFRAIAMPLIEAFTGRKDRFLDTRVEDLDVPDRSFELVVSNNVIEHVGDLERVMASMYRLTAPGGLQVHHCPNYLFPYEPHYKVPVFPCAVQASGAICWRKFRRDPLWQSLNSVSSLTMWRFVRRLPGASITFKNAAAFTLERLQSERHLAARQGALTRIALAAPVRAILTRLPPALMSPMVVEIRKAR